MALHKLVTPPITLNTEFAGEAATHELLVPHDDMGCHLLAAEGSELTTVLRDLPDAWVQDASSTRVVRDEATGRERSVWEGGEEVLAMAYDNPIPGFDTYNTINLRLNRRLTRVIRLRIANLYVAIHTSQLRQAKIAASHGRNVAETWRSF
jgi:hypothetical protein